MNEQKKWFLIINLGLAIAIAYVFRTNISTVLIKISQDFMLNAKQQGLILSVFYSGYVMFMFIGGLVADRIGSVKTIGFSIFALSCCTLVLAFAKSFVSILILRFMIGVFQAPIFPACAKFVNKYFDKSKSGRATSLFDSGAYIGAALCGPFVAFLMNRFSWRISFASCSIIGFAWVVFWIRQVMHNSFLADNNNSIATQYSPKYIITLLCNRKIIGASIGMFCYNYGKNFYLSWMPIYLVNEMHISILEIGYVAAIPWIGAIVGNLSAGAFSDSLLRKGFSLTISRMLPLCIGLLCSSFIVFTIVARSPSLVVIILTFSFAMNIAASSSIWALPGDIAPSNHTVATIGGTQNTIANIAGIVAPLITGYLVYTRGNFMLALLLSGLICVFGAFCYSVIIGKVEPIRV